MGAQMTKIRTKRNSVNHLKVINNSSNLDTLLIGKRKFSNPENTNYLYKNDLQEQDGMIDLHYLHRLVFQSNFSAPIEERLKKGIKVLDLCCGEGTWTLEMANEYPNSFFVGIDILKNYPEQIKPPNVTFFQAGLYETIPFEDNSFDYIFLRNLGTTFTIDEWNRFIFKEVARITRENGFIELAGYPATFQNQGPLMTIGVEAVQQFLPTKGFEKKFMNRIPSWLGETELFWKIEIKEQNCPAGLWGGKLGEACARDVRRNGQSIKGFLMPALNMTNEEYENFFQDIIEELDKYHSYMIFRRVWAQPIKDASRD
ncbi:hypothetical protein G9A89_002348 [Geosiphon pyriformis]|nr:hypothetical protein G9A89_002348 [Geosiphon pyriformis]